MSQTEKWTNLVRDIACEIGDIGGFGMISMRDEKIVAIMIDAMMRAGISEVLIRSAFTRRKGRVGA